MESEYKEIFYRYHSRVLRVAYYILKNREAAEDIAQEVFLKLWNKKDELSKIDSMEGYLVQMSKNAALNSLEELKRFETHLISLQLKLVELGNDHDPKKETVLREKIEKATSALSPQCRLIFSLSRFEGLTNDEIASYLKISKRTVETQISLALKRFRTDLKYLFSSALLPLLTCYLLLLS